MRSWKSHLVVVVVLLGLAFVGYAASLRNGFIWDDNFQIVRNPYVHSDLPLSKILLTDVWGYMRSGQGSMSNYYRPLQILTYRWTAAVAGLNPAGFHLVSILLNWLACVAAYAACWQLTKRFSLAIAASVIFAIHPIHSEAVLWIAALPELGCAVFYFFSFSLFLRAQEAPIRLRKPKAKDIKEDAARRRWLLAASLASFFLALLWKEMALTLPVVIALYVFVFEPSAEPWSVRLRQTALRSLPFWCVTAGYVILRIAVLGYFLQTHKTATLKPWQYLLNVVELIGEYCFRLIAPFHLNAYHVFHAVVAISDPRWILAAVFLIVVIAAILYAMPRAPLAAFAGAWVLLTLAPVLNLNAVGTNIFAERYLYIPSFGFVLLLAWTGAELLKNLRPTVRRNAGIAAVCLLAAGATAETWHRIPAWHDERTFYTDTLAKSPDAAQMRNAYAQVLRDAGDLDGAKLEYQEALTSALAQHSTAQVADAYLGLAFVAWRRQQLPEALDLIERGQTYEDLEPLRTSKGVVLLQMNRVAEAKQVLEEVYRFFPNDEVAANTLGAIALSEHDNEAAIHYFAETVRIDPTFSDGYNNLGRVFMQTGRLADAARAFQRASELQPNNSQFRTNYGVALAKAGRYQEARIQFERVVQTDPRNGYAASLLEELKKVQPQR